MTPHQAMDKNDPAGHSPDSSPPFLEVTSGSTIGKRLEVRTRCIIGRASDCALVIEDRKVSRHHLEVEPVNNRLLVRDLGSRNGVFLNGRQILEGEEVKHGDVLLIGDTFISVQYPSHESHERYGSRWLISVSTSEETHFDELSIPEKITRDHLSEEDLRNLLEVLSLAKENQDLVTIFRRITKHLVDLFKADSAVLCLSSNNTYDPAVILSKEKKTHFLSDILHQTFTQGRGILIQNLHEQLRGSEKEKKSRNLPCSQMCVPFLHQGKIVGLIALGSKQPLMFSKASLNLITVMANHLASTVAQACRTDMLERFHAVEKEKFLQPIVGECEGIKHILRLIGHVSRQSLSILITGETGTGKELVARSIHFQGLHPEGPFVSINCASIPADVFETELFGHEKGAFTGAYRAKPGKFELAQDGTLFFDEVGELPFPLQAKLLRVLETQEFTRLGGTRALYTNARYLFATNKDLEQLFKERRFREDLFYRINTFEIHVPPLRERLEDIPLLVDYFLDQIQGQMGKAQPFRYSPSLIGCLLSYHWPGNIRELRNLLEQLAILSETGYLEEDLLPERICARALTKSDPGLLKKAEGLLYRITDKTQKQIILQALKESRGEKKQAAKILGISRPTLDKRLQQYGIQCSEKESQDPEARGAVKKLI